jgi:spore maturation protein CgeB
MNWKEIAKKSDLLSWINSKFKCYELKRGLARLGREYESKANIYGYDYDSKKAIEEFKSRHHKYRPDFAPVGLGVLRVFWIGASQSQDESGFLQALHRVANVTIFYNSYSGYGLWQGDGKVSFAEVRKVNDDAIYKQVCETHAECGIDVLLGQMWAQMLSKEMLAKIQDLGIPVVNIAMDDRLPIHWTSREGIRLGSIGLSPNIDMALTTSLETCMWYGVEGCPALFWPLASDPLIFAPVEGALRDIDVLFIGNRYGVRGKIVAYLERHGIVVTCYGRGWPNGLVDAKQNGTLSKRARIILGVGTVGHCSDVYTLKLRDFDGLMTGALYVTHRNPDLCNIFKEGKEIECYNSKQEAVEKIRYYLAHAKEREQIGRMGQHTALNRHTWDYRLTETFSLLGLLSSAPVDSENTSIEVKSK